MTLYAGEIHQINDHSEILNDPDCTNHMRQRLLHGDLYIARKVFEPKQLGEIKSYLTAVGQSSLPNYHKIEPGAPNFHRLNHCDPRAYVGGTFHQFCFFPWNQDVFNLFDLFGEVYRVKNVLSGLPSVRYVGKEPEDGCIARLAFQVYPKGLGTLNCHSDPVDYHQLTVPILQMSQKGTDYQTGGLYVVRESGEKIDLDSLTEPGDVIYFNAECPHGVLPIDPDIPANWLTFEGRWMLLFAVNRLFDNAKISDSAEFSPRKSKYV